MWFPPEWTSSDHFFIVQVQRCGNISEPPEFLPIRHIFAHTHNLIMNCHISHNGDFDRFDSGVERAFSAACMLALILSLLTLRKSEGRASSASRTDELLSSVLCIVQCTFFKPLPLQVSTFSNFEEFKLLHFQASTLSNSYIFKSLSSLNCPLSIHVS